MNKYKENILITFIIFLALIGSLTSFGGVIAAKFQRYSEVNLIQPNIQQSNYLWNIRSIDTQVVSKHWENVTRESIRDQVKLIKSLGANYVAIGTPYNRVDDMRIWVEEIHNAGMNVWFRSHWNEWEGDEGTAGTLKPDKYLENTDKFIINNPDLFKEGDSFTVCVEAEQVGIGLGKRFLDWNEYKTFLLDQIYVANKSFEKIGLKGKVFTNWISVNGWIVNNIYDQKLVDKIGLITIDHYVGQTNTIGQMDESNRMVDQTLEDLDTIHDKFNVPVLVGEWGYQIYQPVSDVRQADVINKMFLGFKTKSYILGINYWVHMGNSSAIFGDERGTNLTPRMGAGIISSFYNSQTSQVN